MLRNKKGMSLAEVLLVLSIICVIVGIGVPIFSTQLESAKERHDIDTMRSAENAAMTGYLNKLIETGTYWWDSDEGSLTTNSFRATECGQGTAKVGSENNTRDGYRPSDNVAGKALRVTLAGIDPETGTSDLTIEWVAKP